MASLPVLENARIATPCPASWEQMTGDDRVRHCGQCKLNVYNFAELTQREIERLILKTEGRLCGRLYRRADGTIITRDCPVGLMAVRRRLAGAVGRIAAAIVVVGGMFGLLRQVTGANTSEHRLAQLEPFATIQRWLDPGAVAPPPPLMMGEIVYTPPAQQTPPASACQ